MSNISNNCAVIRRELYALTRDFRRAVILNQLLYWSERVRDFEDFINEERQRAAEPDTYIDTPPEHGWIYKTAMELAEETMLGLSKSNMLRHSKFLVDNGWLFQRRNPKNKMDRTYQYRVNLIKIQEDLVKLESTLFSYRVPLDFIPEHNEEKPRSDREFPSPVAEPANSSSKLASSKTELQYHRVLTENTSENTSNNISMTLTQDYDTQASETKLPQESKNDVVVGVREEIEFLLKTPIKTVTQFSPWVTQYGREYLVAQANYILSHVPKGGWANPVGAWCQAVVHDWNNQSKLFPSPVESVQKNGVWLAQDNTCPYDKRYHNFYMAMEKDQYLDYVHHHPEFREEVVQFHGTHVFEEYPLVYETKSIAS